MRWQFHGNPLLYMMDKLPIFIVLPGFILMIRAFQVMGRNSIPQEEKSLLAFLQKYLQASLIN